MRKSAKGLMIAVVAAVTALATVVPPGVAGAAILRLPPNAGAGTQLTGCN